MNNFFKNIVTAVTLTCPLFSLTSMAQDSTTHPKPTVPLSFNIYLESYYSHDFNNPLKNIRPGFIYSHNRSNEVNLNLGMIKAGYHTQSVRANLALAAGTYMNANYSAEPGVLKNVFEANIGMKISNRRNLWLDVGVMPSHIGFESAIGKDNWTLTRSLVAENSPYFETGAKLGYTSKNDKWYLAALYLNGWQRIQRADGNSTPGWGAVLTFKPSANIILNYSAFAGNDKPDSARQMRYFNNLYGIFQLCKEWGITAGLDYGLEQTAKGSDDYNHWYAPVLILQYQPTTKVSIAARAEYYHDPNATIVATGTKQGFQTWGFSANVDYHIGHQLLWRLEVRHFRSKDAVFYRRSGLKTDQNTAVTTSISFGL